ncbi:sigma-54-dependent Fis family transcriptional regulator [Phyllobacterium myrsinacearum]|uniref:Transcriptional regulator of acetoin/glycerol metabolism n=1 Tax=Phyllobacterium myrsinacearum TaxID=28101 RepID=A0A839EJV0_9HYPH|nr:sigma-54-dependent Fis family transcriptional regulator [Phyllobacterium myrsinacearum]MBA8879079.1 transcriptional regulator of acetoin/glycerol metabolism [Phyllobacterium myrsinacearum]
MSLHSEHIREIEKVGLGGSTNRDETVVESWRRCITQHRLDPALACEAYIVPETQLREHRQQSEQLISIARSGLENLFRHVAGQNYVLLLSDREGVTVEFLGDPLFDNNLRKAGLYLGSEWSESRAGTCAVGSCLETGEALTIHQTDHFDNTHTPLTCTAAPIYDAQGHLSAVLDISLLRSPQIKASQNLALHLVTATVRRIELANLMAQTRNEWVLRFSRSPEFLDVDPEAAISIDGSGHIIGMTHDGAKILARAAGLDWRYPAGLIGQPIARFFDMDTDDLGNLTRTRPSEDRLVFARDGNMLFAHAIEPHYVLRGTQTISEPIPASLRRLSNGDPQLAALQTKAAKLAGKPVAILIQGETGTGKEFLARAIHDSSGAKGRFIAVNCAAMPEQLIESELFGYTPGAFTGALAKGRKGLVEEADGGTLFLDEIGDMPLALQSRLLRVLAEREVLPLGASRAKPVNVRILSASHRNLAELVGKGAFREDLFYRLNAATLSLPALRDRDDFDWLLTEILKKRTADTGSTPVLSPEARLALQQYTWPGNIRELCNVLDVASALCDNARIQLIDLPDTIQKPASTSFMEEKRASDGVTALKQALAASHGNVSAAARLLGVDRSTVHRQLQKLRRQAAH